MEENKEEREQIAPETVIKMKQILVQLIPMPWFYVVCQLKETRTEL